MPRQNTAAVEEVRKRGGFAMSQAACVRVTPCVRTWEVC